MNRNCDSLGIAIGLPLIMNGIAMSRRRQNDLTFDIDGGCSELRSDAASHDLHRRIDRRPRFER